MDVVQYARVSREIQARGDSVSIDQQKAEMQALCERMGWNTLRVYVDSENYKATQSPRKGKIVNPSGERADRPQLLEMLEMVKTGEPGAVVCWRDDRLVRHPRVAVALEDALDIGDVQRNGRGKIQIYDAAGAQIDRFTLSIKATIWREENKRRAERSRMGKLATLQQGRWPGGFNCYGYKTVKENGKRGNLIVLDPETVPTVRRIYEEYGSGLTLSQLRARLIADEVPQPFFPSLQRHQWSNGLLHQILTKEAYLGTAVWTFKDGTVVEVEVPQIIERELWQRVQRVMQRNKTFSARNAKGIYLLQGLTRCGDCGNGLSITTSRTSGGGYFYRCHVASHNNRHEGSHPRPYSHGGPSLDWAVWRHIVDNGIKRPDIIRAHVLERQAELQTQGESVDSEITHARRRLAEVDQSRAFYQRQAARGKLTEREFDARMEETEAEQEYRQEELIRLQELRDNAAKVQSGLDYATELLTTIQARLSEIDQTPKELRRLPEDDRNEILKARRKIIRTLCDEVIVWADKRVKLVGVLDGSEAERFALESPSLR